MDDEQMTGWMTDGWMESFISSQRPLLYHPVALPFTLKKRLKAKEELQKLKYFTMQKYNLQKILQEKPKSFKIF